MAVRFIPVSSREEFMAYRSNGVGASEIGTLFGVNEHECRLSLYHSKLGVKPPKEMNLRMNIGHISEDLIARLYEHYNEDLSIFNRNLEHGMKERKLETVNAYCVNDKFQNIFVSLDRREIAGDEFYAIELKNKKSSAYNQWKDDLNPIEMFQLATQLLVSEYPKGNLVYFIDNEWIEPLPMPYEYAKKVQKVILSEVSSFWGKIENARLITNQIHFEKSRFNMKAVAELTLELMKCEPEPENSEAYLNYMTELSIAKRESVPIKGTDEMLSWAKSHRKIAEKIKKLEKEKIEFASKLAHAMGDKKEIDFGKEGKVSLWGRFQNKVK